MRPVPDDFAEVALHLSARGIEKHYTAGKETVARWCAAQSDDWRMARKANMTQHIIENSRRVGLANRRAQANAKRAPNPAAHRTIFGVSVQRVTGGEAAVAADYLRRTLRHVRPICAATVTRGPSGAGAYQFGSIVLSNDELVAKAKASGWQPDAWREIAA